MKETRPKTRLYIETTIPNYIFNESIPDKQDAAKRLFSLIRQGVFDSFVSSITIGEISKSPEPKRSKMIEVIQNITVLEPTPKCIFLADEYIKRHIIPRSFYNDGLHIAIATVNYLDAVVSYNFQHIVNLRTIKGVTAINILNNFPTPAIVSPEEVIYGAKTEKL